MSCPEPASETAYIQYGGGYVDTCKKPSAPLPRFLKACCPPNMCLPPTRPICCPAPCFPCLPNACCRPNYPLCCRPPWDISPPKFPRTVDFCAAPLACRSEKYRCWLGNFGPKVDSNLCASLYSSRVSNAGYTMTKVQPPEEFGTESPYCHCHGGPYCC